MKDWITNTKMRTLPLEGGKKTTVKFDPVTWRAIDLLAAREGMRWTQWMRKLMAAHPGAENMHATVRAAAIEGLLAEQIIADRADQLTPPRSPLLANAGTLDDGQLVEELEQAHVEAGPFDLGGFTVRVGTDMNGRACIWIENMLRACPHYAIPLPFTVAEIEAKVGAGT